MSQALLATILIVLDGHAGNWCTLNWLIQRTAAPQSMVLPHCVALVESCQVRTREVNGVRQFGIGVDDKSPTVDWRPDDSHPGECVTPGAVEV